MLAMPIEMSRISTIQPAVSFKRTRVRVLIPSLRSEHQQVDQGICQRASERAQLPRRFFLLCFAMSFPSSKAAMESHPNLLYTL